MEPRLFNLDLQLVTDSILMILALAIPLLVISLIIFLLVKSIRNKNSKDCANCSYCNNNPYNN